MNKAVQYITDLGKTIDLENVGHVYTSTVSTWTAVTFSVPSRSENLKIELVIIEPTFWQKVISKKVRHVKIEKLAHTNYYTGASQDFGPYHIEQLEKYEEFAEIEKQLLDVIDEYQRINNSPEVDLEKSIDKIRDYE